MNEITPKIKSRKRRIIAIAGFALLLSLITLSSFAQSPIASGSSGATSSIVFSPPINLSNDGAVASYPWIANVGPHAYVAWTEESRGLMFRSSSDAGDTWNPPVSSQAMKLSNPGGVAEAPIVCANSSNVYVSWSQTVTANGNSTGLQVFVASSNNYGATFSSAVQLSHGSPPGGWITPVCAAAGNDAYVNWINGSPNQSWIASTNNGGKTWSAPYQYGLSKENQLAALSTSTTQNVYSYANRDVMVSSNGGQTWTHSITTSGDEGMITASGPYVYIATQTKTPDGYVHFYYSNNYGKSFKRVNDSTPSLPDSWEPMLASYGNSVWMTLIDYPGGVKSNIYVYTSHNGGTSWASGPISVSGTGYDANYPFTISSSDGQNVFLGFTQQTSGKSGWGPGGVWTFKVAYSTDGGNTWTSGVNVSQNSHGAAAFQSDLATGAISSYGTQCFATWEYVNGSSTQVYFSASALGSGSTTSSTTSSSSHSSASTTKMSTSTSASSSSSSTAVSKSSSHTTSTITTTQAIFHSSTASTKTTSSSEISLPPPGSTTVTQKTMTSSSSSSQSSRTNTSVPSLSTTSLWVAGVTFGVIAIASVLFVGSASRKRG